MRQIHGFLSYCFFEVQSQCEAVELEEPRQPLRGEHVSASCGDPGAPVDTFDLLEPQDLLRHLGPRWGDDLAKKEAWQERKALLAKLADFQQMYTRLKSGDYALVLSAIHRVLKHEVNVAVVQEARDRDKSRSQYLRGFLMFLREV